jgi:hypothetical protein
MRCLAESERLSLQFKKGEFFRREAVEFWTCLLLKNVRDRVLAIPSRTSRLLLHKTDLIEANQILDAACREALTEASETNLMERFKEETKRYLRAKRLAHGEQGFNGEREPDEEPADV